MQDEVVAAMLPGAALDLANEKVSAAEVDLDLGADRIAAHVSLVDAAHLDLQPVISASQVDEDLSIGHQIEVSVVVQVRPGGLVGDAQVSEAGLGGYVGEIPVPLITVQHGALIADRTALDGSADPEVQIPAVVVVGESRCGD